MGTKVRILVATHVGGVLYYPDQVVDLPAVTAKQLVAGGQVDAHKEAVAYCVNELGAEVIVHQTPPTPEEIQLQADIAELEAKLATATDDAAKQALQAALDEKKALLG
jgi:ABC-type nitrate/sulfonate/bicarbonate transport system substrate-binding protein